MPVAPAAHCPLCGAVLRVQSIMRDGREVRVVLEHECGAKAPAGREDAPGPAPGTADGTSRWG